MASYGLSLFSKNINPRIVKRPLPVGETKFSNTVVKTPTKSAKRSPAFGISHEPVYTVSKQTGNKFFQQRFFHSSRSLNGLVQFNLADIGEGIAECEILKWHVKEGDNVKQFDLLCEVQSDKATVEITSRYDGIIKKVHYKKNEMAKVGSPLVDIETEGAEEAKSQGHGASSAEAQKQQQPQQVQQLSQQQVEQNSQVLATPAVRHLAAKHQLPLQQIPPTGKGGRVLKEDVLKFISGGVGEAVSEFKPVTTSTQPPPQMPTPTVTAQDRVIPLSGYSRVMVKTMTIANTIPHFGYCDEIIADQLLSFRAQLKKIAEERGIRLTLMPIIIKAISLALKHYPMLNGSFDEKQMAMIYKASHNIGIAVDTPNGLVVPNIKNCQDKSILDIAAELNRIHKAALNAQVPKEDLTGGTFSLSNIGSIGGTYASPVIVPPEVAIGAIGRIQKVPRFNDKGEVVPVSIFNISWSADHRVIDGATMANFSNLWKKYLEHPNLMVVDTR